MCHTIGENKTKGTAGVVRSSEPPGVQVDEDENSYYRLGSLVVRMTRE